MQVTEPFATTVAAVAPVLILVGTVEMGMLSKRALETLAEADRPMAEAVELIQATPGLGEAGVRPEVERLAHQDVKRSDAFKLTGFIVTASLWALMCLALSNAFASSLQYLTYEDPRPEESATWIYVIMISGFFWVTLVPLIEVLFRLRRSIQEADERKRVIEGFLRRPGGTEQSATAESLQE
ncbi:hypothetical protein AB0B13_20045 [Streptomyces sp. NPDC042898]|uniref:hypothetical protein n=1 Tax=Streptomyces sp. NPDC042898 TaxID=3154334 RepID=UPI0033D0DAC4